jgi:hypothetical protein
MDSSFTLTIDWLAFTVLASNPQETMRVLGGDWSKAKGGFRGYPLSWMRSDGLRGVGKLGTNAPRRPNEIHVDLSGGLASALTLDQIRTLLSGCTSNKDTSPGSIAPWMTEPDRSPVQHHSRGCRCRSVCHSGGSGQAYRLQPDAWHRSDHWRDDVLRQSAESDLAADL